MKATDLMIGDWVNGWDGRWHPIQISAISSYPTNRPSVVAVGGYGYAIEDQLQPIPLTDVILRKNGFEYYHKNYASLSYGHPFGLEMVEWPDINGQGGLWTVNGIIKIRYVNDLQHVLPLAEIEKRIII